MVIGRSAVWVGILGSLLACAGADSSVTVRVHAVGAQAGQVLVLDVEGLEGPPSDTAAQLLEVGLRIWREDGHADAPVWSGSVTRHCRWRTAEVRADGAPAAGRLGCRIPTARILADSLPPAPYRVVPVITARRRTTEGGAVALFLSADTLPFIEDVASVLRDLVLTGRGEVGRTDTEGEEELRVEVVATNTGERRIRFSHGPCPLSARLRPAPGTAGAVWRHLAGSCEDLQIVRVVAPGERVHLPAIRIPLPQVRGDSMGPGRYVGSVDLELIAGVASETRTVPAGSLTLVLPPRDG